MRARTEIPSSVEEKAAWEVAAGDVPLARWARRVLNEAVRVPVSVADAVRGSDGTGRPPHFTDEEARFAGLPERLQPSNLPAAEMTARRAANSGPYERVFRPDPRPSSAKKGRR